MAEAAQHALMWPLPRHLGPLQLACLYLAAEDEAEIGGDLYAAARTDQAVRLLIGEVRGKGLPAIGEAALLLGAFREATHQHAYLLQLAAALERSVARYLTDFEPEDEAGERFVTALLLEIPDDDPVICMTSCGHLAPMLFGPDHSVTVSSLNSAPPLGLGLTSPEDHALDVLPFGSGDTVLLYTDGVIEARDRHGAFYPFAERVAQWADHNPEALLHHIRRDLVAHTADASATTSPSSPSAAPSFPALATVSDTPSSPGAFRHPSEPPSRPGRAADPLQSSRPGSDSPLQQGRLHRPYAGCTSSSPRGLPGFEVVRPRGPGHAGGAEAIRRRWLALR
ncbi:PP2C family protein-serine/threonine phosphatase [Streptomyces sp. NPDC001698]|uniref:PP2C family protein-serine/threonine phosphatase n=1 Tax=Streptomyces sp. NPDC001698 TaxID=3364601 RepID=UPI0036BF5AF4